MSTSISLIVIFVFAAGASVVSTVTANDQWTNYYNEDLFYENGHNITVEDAYVNGNIYIRNCSNVNITSSHINGNIEIRNNQGYLKIDNIYIDGNLIISLSYNIEVHRNEIKGNIESYKNDYINVKQNTVWGNLIFKDNTHLTGSDNTVYGDTEYEYKTDERDLQIEVSNSIAKIESELEKETMENEIEIEFSTGEGIALDLEYSSEINATEYELELEVRFLRLVEFVDQNGNGTLDEGEAVQTIDLTDVKYSTPTVIPIASSDGEAGFKLESHLVDETFIFQIIAYIFPKHAAIEDTSVNPTETKITIVIKNFPYKQDDSALALLIKATSEMEIEKESTDNEEEIEIESDTATGYFSWINEVSVDNEAKPVNSTVMKTDEGSLISLNYPHGTEIVHDPKLGVNILAEPEPEFPWLYIIAVAAIIAVVVAIAKRKM